MRTRITLAREGEEVGAAIVYSVPLHRDRDYDCFPPGVLTFEQAKDVAAELAKGRDTGQVGTYEWWESGQR